MGIYVESIRIEYHVKYLLVFNDVEVSDGLIRIIGNLKKVFSN